MGTMRDFWARERLLRHIGERHDTDDVSRIVDIAKTAGYLDQSGQLTELGKHLARENLNAMKRVVLRMQIIAQEPLSCR